MTNAARCGPCLCPPGELQPVRHWVPPALPERGLPRRSAAAIQCGMGEFRRTLLIWIMAMLLPMQGMASAAGLLCAPGHLPALGSTSVQGKSAAHTHHGPQDAATGAFVDAGHAHHGALGAGAAAGADALEQGASPHPADDSCSACSACCAGAVLPSSTVTLARVDLARPVLRAPDSSVASIVGRGLERPPRA